MGKKHFTTEQLESLQLNQYVEKVSIKSITYTEKFKEDFYIAYSAGKGATAILRDMGFDTLVLGRHRISSIVQRTKTYEKRLEGFKDTRVNNVGRPKTKELSPEEYIKHLEHKVKFQNQQIEALKKMKLLDKQAQWKYLQNQKKNIKSSKK